MTVDVLTTAGWMYNVGDVASCKATLMALAERGIPACPVDVSRDNTTVIGGGHVLGHMEHLRHFILPGPHVLNAVGAHRTGDFSYLKEYKYVSVREKTSAEIIGVPCCQVPCPAILLEPSEIILRRVAGRKFGHIVCQRDRAVERSMESRYLADLTVLHTGPSNLPWNLGGEILPPIHSPEIVIAHMIGAHAAVVRSLHLGIFALAAGVPFACIDTGDEPQSNKMRDYWQRAGIPGVMYNGNDPIRHAVGLKYNWQEVREAERSRCRKHFDEMAKTLV